MLSLKADTLCLPQLLRRSLEQAWASSAEALNISAYHYPDPNGEAELLEVLSRLYPYWKGERLVTNSATEALYLSLQALKSALGERLRVAVRAPCFFGVLRQLKLLGIAFDEFEQLDELTRLPFTCLLLTSHFAPPYGRSLDAPERTRVEEALARNDAYLIEDNPYDPLWFTAPPEPLATGRAIRIGSLSKILTPVFRLGFLQTEDALFKTLRSHKITLNLSTQSALQQVAASALTPSYLNTLRAVWHTRACRLRVALLDSGIECVEPEGGCFMGLPCDTGLIERAAQAGVLLDENAHYYADARARPYARLHFGALEADLLVEAARLLSKVYRPI